MVNLLSLFLNTNFWLVLNVILLGAIIGLVYYRYLHERRVRVVSAQRRPERGGVKYVVERFNALLDRGAKEAILVSFNSLMAELGAEQHPDKTYREFIQSLGTVSGVSSSLTAMYGVYERLRFSDSEPTYSDLVLFKENLYKIAKYLR